MRTIIPTSSAFLMKHKQFTASYRAQHNRDLRKRTTARLMDGDAPLGVPVSKVRNLRIREGISLHDARVLARPPSHTGTKQFAKNGCTVREIVSATPWHKGRYK